MDELRAVVGYAVACAEPALVLFQKVRPDDTRPAAALHAARVFSEGLPARASNARPRSTPTGRLGRRRPKPPGTPRSLLGMPPRRHTSIRWRRRPRCATSWARLPLPPTRPGWPGDDPVVAEYVITAAAKQAVPIVLDVLTRYRGSRRAHPALGPPAPARRPASGSTTDAPRGRRPRSVLPRTRADLRPGDLLTGWRSNYGRGARPSTST